MTDPEISQPAAPGATNVYVQQTPASQNNGLAVASLVLGILSILLAIIPIVGFIAWIMAPVGLILGIIGLGKPTGKGMAIAGVVCSAIGLLICIGWVILFAIGMAGAAASGEL
jgi:hypothetical protein